MDFALTESERNWHTWLHGLRRDKLGREVLAGLTFAETVFYFCHQRSCAASGASYRPAPGAVMLFNELRDRFEFARFADCNESCQSPAWPRQRLRLASRARQ